MLTFLVSGDLWLKLRISTKTRRQDQIHPEEQAARYLSPYLPSSLWEMLWEFYIIIIQINPGLTAGGTNHNAHHWRYILTPVSVLRAL